MQTIISEKPTCGRTTKSSKKHLSTGQKKQILASYNSGESIKRIAARHGKTQAAIYYMLNKLGVNFYRPDLFSEQLIESIKEEYRGGESASQIAVMYNVCISSVWRIVRGAGLVEKGTRKYRVHNFDESFFEKIDTEHKAYFLGLMFADGCVTDDGGVRISLQHGDSAILNKFRDSIGLQRELLELNPKPCRPGSVSQPQTLLYVNSVKMAADLYRHGCTPRKSLTVEFPTTVSDDLMHHFLRGYLDGDGWICGRRNKSGIRVGMIGSGPFIHKAGQVIGRASSVNVRYEKTPHPSVIKLIIGGGHQSRSVLSYLYSGATVWLNRKRVLAERIWAKEYYRTPS